MFNMTEPVTQDVRARIDFYSELLKAEEESAQDLEYWLTYAVEFGVSHKVPLYDKMSTIKYLNIEVWSLVALALICVYVCITKSLVFCFRCCGYCKAQTVVVEAKEKAD